MNRRSVILQTAASLLILGGLAKAVLDNQERRIPSWAASSGNASPECAAVLAWLKSQSWADGDTFAILHASRPVKDFDRFGPRPSRPASAILVEYLRTLDKPSELSAQPSPQRFVFVLDESGGVIRRLQVDRLHSPYGDLFGL